MDATITTSGHGSAAGTPDAMRLHLAVVTFDRDVEAALATLSAGVLRLGQVAREHTSEDRISTRGMELWGQRDAPEGAGFRASESVEVFCDSLDGAGALLAALGRALGQGLEIRQVQPVLSDTEDLARTARARAFDAAHAKAEELAALAGRGLGAVVTVVDGARDRPFDGEVMTASAGVPFEAGSMDVTATVTVTWTLR